MMNKLKTSNRISSLNWSELVPEEKRLVYSELYRKAFNPLLTETYEQEFEETRAQIERLLHSIDQSHTARIMEFGFPDGDPLFAQLNQHQ